MNLFNIPIGPFGMILEYLDATSRAALFSSCRVSFFELRPKLEEKYLHTDVVIGIRVVELRKFLNTPSQDGKSGAFGNAGTTAALSYLPTRLLHRAFACLFEDHPDCKGELQVLLWEYVLPVTAWLNCRIYCDLLASILDERLTKDDMALGPQWEPQPAAVYLVLCVVDYYLPRILGKRTPKLGLVDPERKRCSMRNLVVAGKNSLLKSASPLPQRLDDILWKFLGSLHPVLDFRMAVGLLVGVTKEFDARYVEPTVYGKFMQVISSGGFFRSDVDSRLHCLPVSCLQKWVSETPEEDEEKQDWNYVAAMAFRKALAEAELQTEHEIEERGMEEILRSFLVNDNYSLYDCEDEDDGILFDLEAMGRLLFGDEGFIAQYGIVRSAGW